MHARPIISAGLVASLTSKHWTVTNHAERPDSIHTADAVVADYGTGIDFARSQPPFGKRPHVIILTDRDKEADIRRALEAAIAGYVLVDADATQLQHAVHHVLTGSQYLCPGIKERIAACLHRESLTNRERDVLGLLARGLCNKRIARELGIEVGTVKWHLRSLMGKLGVTARTQAVIVAAQRGLVGLDESFGS